MSDNLSGFSSRMGHNQSRTWKHVWNRPRSRATSTITGVVAFFNGQNIVGVFDLHAQDALECQKSLCEGYFPLADFYAWAACNRQNTKE